MSAPIPDLPLDSSKCWDVIIIGTGMGGATAGRVLADTGVSILFVEKGGDIAAGDMGRDLVTPEARLARGWWPNPISQRRADGGCDRFFAPLGCAAGGSSIHYAAALERMSDTDFDALITPTRRICAWPVGFEEFLPYYEAAEALYGIRPESRGDAERRLSPWDRALMESMRNNGLSPEVLHVAMRYDEQCQECIGKICERQCKADARVVGLEVALRSPHCEVLYGCEVRALLADRCRVHGVRVRRLGEEFELNGRIVLLAAGALHSPQILLRSRSAHWPTGLANSSDQVGRNLMFHTADLYALWAPRRMDRRGRQRKALSIRDFYLHEGRRLGYVQSMGLEVGRGAIAVYVKDLLRRHGLQSELLLKLLAVAPSYIGAIALGSAVVFAAMTEDDPSPENRVLLDASEPDEGSFAYTITEDLRERAALLQRALAQHVRPWRVVRLTPTLTMNYGHPCGTCRFGNDPRESVLDRNCKAHDLENLYVVDASFMPRSGAINPSLTIAANALRVAHQISTKLMND